MHRYRFLTSLVYAICLTGCVSAVVTVPALAQIQGPAPELRLRETDQTLPAGLWRLRVQGDTFTIERAADSAFSTSTVPVSISSASAVTFAGVITGPSNVLSVQNSTTAQALRVFGSTSGSKYAEVSHNGTDAKLNSSAGNLNFELSGTRYVYLDAANPSLVFPNGTPLRLGNVATATLNASGQLSIVNTNAESRVGLNTASNTASHGSEVRFDKYHGSQASPTIVSSGETVGRLLAQGYDGASLQPAAKIEFLIDGTPGSSDMPGRIEFYTTPDGSAALGLALTISSTKRSSFGGPAKMMSYTVATLPTGSLGDLAIVTDSLGGDPAGATVRAGGSTKMLVIFNGSDWVGFGF